MADKHPLAGFPTAAAAVRKGIACLGLIAGLVVGTTSTPSLFAQDHASRIDSTLQQFHETRDFNGSVLVAEAGEVIFKKGFGYANMEWRVPNTPDTKFRIGSVTKQFTAILILQLVEEGAIELNGQITDYVPDYPRPQGDLVTIHHLLNHTSGIPSYTGLPGFMEEHTRDPFVPDSLVAIVSGLPLEFEVGTEYRYNNSGYFILGLTIEKVTGKPYDVVLRQRLLDPLGLRDTGYDHTREVQSHAASGYSRTMMGYEVAPYLHSSVPYAAGMMYSTVEDLYRWDQAIAARDERILEDSGSWERMFTPGLSDYGYGWVIRKTQMGEDGPAVNVIEHGGGIFGFSTAFRRFPDERNTVIVMDNTTEDAGAVAAAITRVLYDLPVDPPEPSIAERILPVIENAGADAGIQRYHDLKRRSTDEYDFSEPELNRLGYYLLGKGEIDAAVKVFRLNVEAHPDAANPYDSLGEALLAAGDTVGAIESYLASLERNRGNTNAAAVLEGLDVSVDRAMLEGIDVPVQVLEGYVGEYEINPGFNLTVRREGKRLFTRATGQAEFEIFATSSTLWFVKAFDARLEFRVGTDGVAESVTLHQGGQQRRARRIP